MDQGRAQASPPAADTACEDFHDDLAYLGFLPGDGDLVQLAAAFGERVRSVGVGVRKILGHPCLFI